MSSSRRNQRSYVYLVIHDRLPTYSMYFRDEMYSEPIETVNSTVVGVYTTQSKADRTAREYFFWKQLGTRIVVRVRTADSTTAMMKVILEHGKKKFG